MHFVEMGCRLLIVNPTRILDPPPRERFARFDLARRREKSTPPSFIAVAGKFLKTMEFAVSYWPQLDAIL